MAKSSLFVNTPSAPSVPRSSSTSSSVLPKLSSHGNLLAGAFARVAVGFILNPLSVLKARFEVCSFVSLIHHVCI